MGLVKTRRLAAMHPPSLKLWRTGKQQRAIHLRQGFHLRQGYGGQVGGLKAAMELSMKGGARKGDGVFWLRDGCTDKGKVYR